ncbi:MAG: N,N-dimethylformamidase beta subunit family domain-containing protein [Pirellula sp.]
MMNSLTTKKRIDSNSFRPSVLRRRRLVIESLEQRVVLSANAIVNENLLPGAPASQWDIVGVGDTTLQGYATNISVDAGESIEFKINNQSLSPYRLDIYRIGYYGGNGARLVATIPSSQTVKQVQPAPLTNAATGLVDAGNWSVSASWQVPSTAVSGVYIARPVREDTGGASHIIFVVRDDDGGSDVLFQTSDTTWQAYNRWGGNSLYVGTPSYAHAVSYNRPFDTRAVTAKDWFFSSEYATVRWLEKNGYDVSYTTGVDTDRRGNELLEHKIFVSAGHDEYWSGDQRANVEAARDAGVNLAFFSGNEVYWKTRWENSIDASGTPYRTLVTYKETWANAKIDPLANVWTGTWRDDRFSPPADGGRPENALTGQLFTVNRGPGGDTGTPFTVGAEFAGFSFWRDTRIASLQPGQSTNVGDYVLGYEWNEDIDNGFRPAGLLRMSSTTQNVPQKIDQYGGPVTTSGQATHSLTLYRAKSGALVFGAGTINWGWGLDGTHDVIPSVPDPAIQQAIVNLFADMGVQPTTLQTGIVRATMTTDLLPPVSSVTSISSGTVVSTGVPVLLSGTSSDNGGGVVGGVEVSVDAGRTWRRANGGSSWTYQWIPSDVGPTTICSRSVDDKGNIETVSAGVNVVVALSPTSSLGLVAAYSFDEGTGSVLYDSSSGGNNGTISGAVFAPGFTGQALSFDGVNDLVTIADSNSLDVVNGLTLEAWVKPFSRAGYSSILLKEKGSNGLAYALYANDGSNSLPAGYINAKGRNNNYSDFRVTSNSSLTLNAWTHLAVTYDKQFLKIYANGVFIGQTVVEGDVFESSGALQIGGNQVFSAEYFHGLIDEVRIYNRPLSNAEILYNMSQSVGGVVDTIPPVASIGPASSIVSGPLVLNVTATDNVVVSRINLFVDGQLISSMATAPYETTIDTTQWPNGQYTITGWAVDAVGNIGLISPWGFEVANPTDVEPPTVRLLHPDPQQWVSGATVLAAVSFDNVRVEGVQFQVNGVSVGVKDTTAPYRVLWDSSELPDGDYTVSAISTDLAGNSSTVTIIVKVDNSTPFIVSRTPAAGATDVDFAFSSTIDFSEEIDLSAGLFELRNSFGNLIPTITVYNSSLKRLVATSNLDLSPGGTYTIKISGVRDQALNQMPTESWAFTTRNAVVNSSLWDSSFVPVVGSVADTSPVEVGVRFQTSLNGYFTGIRYYRGATNPGPHTGRLWSSTGTLLASVTFTSESTTGWQQANFSVPVSAIAGANYVVSYYAPNGGYAATSGYFANSRTNGPLIAPASVAGSTNGLYFYGLGGGFPVNSFNATNYWVDVMFSNSLADMTPPSIVSRTPSANAVGVTVTSKIKAVLSEAVRPSTIAMVLRDSQQNLVPASISYDSQTATVTLSPSASLQNNASYSVSMSDATDFAGNIMTASTWTFTTGGQHVDVSLWNNATLPAVSAANDSSPVELGVKFQSAQNGFITGLKFYKGVGNNGLHIGNLWTATGSLIASQAFSEESATGWQSVTFVSPVAITANTTYVASYFAPQGRYAVDTAYFASSFVNGPLRALANSEEGGNGVYRYSAASSFPNQTFNSSNYWVDVAFSELGADVTPPTVTTNTPAAGAINIDKSTNVSATFSESVLSASIVIQLRDSQNNIVASQSSYSVASRTVQLDPVTDLIAGETYTVSVSGATDGAGNMMTPVQWSFRVKAAYTQTTLADFAQGTHTGTIATGNGGGAIQIATAFQDDFSEEVISDIDWQVSAWSTGNAVGNSQGLLSVQGSLVVSQATYVDQTVEGLVQFGAVAYQHFGLATRLDTLIGNYWAIFSTGATTNRLFARVNISGVTSDIDVGALPTGFHTYQVRSTATGFSFYLDGNLLTSITAAVPVSTPMRIAMSSYFGTPTAALQVDSVRIVNAAPQSFNGSLWIGVFTSATFDAGSVVQWASANWNADTPVGTGLTIEIMTSNDSSFAGATWLPLSNGQSLASLGLQGRYLRYRVTLTTLNALVSPRLNDISIDWL